MCTTCDERRSKKHHLKLKSVCTALSTVRVEKGQASLVIHYSRGYILSQICKCMLFLSFCDSEMYDIFEKGK